MSYAVTLDELAGGNVNAVKIIHSSDFLILFPLNKFLTAG